MKNKLNLIIAWQLVLSCLFLSGFTYTLKTSTPAGSDSPTEADDRIREKAAAFVERLDVDHYWTASATSTYDAADTGKHEVITLLDMSAPTQVSGYAHIFMDSDEFYYQDDTNTKLKLTDSGTINIVSADLLATLANNTYFTAVDVAGTGTVNLIKADANDVAVVPDNSQTASNAAPTSTTGIANKKYVDDQKDSTYSGGESHTFNGGLIIKMGSVSVGANSSVVVTFGTAFPAAIIMGVCNYGSSAIDSFSAFSSKTTSSITVTSQSGATETIDWIAIGY